MMRLGKRAKRRNSLGGLQSDPLSPSLAKIETVVKQDRDGDR